MESEQEDESCWELRLTYTPEVRSSPDVSQAKMPEQRQAESFVLCCQRLKISYRLGLSVGINIGVLSLVRGIHLLHISLNEHKSDNILILIGLPIFFKNQ